MKESLGIIALIAALCLAAAAAAFALDVPYEKGITAVLLIIGIIVIYEIIRKGPKG